MRAPCLDSCTRRRHIGSGKVFYTQDHTSAHARTQRKTTRSTRIPHTTHTPITFGHELHKAIAHTSIEEQMRSYANPQIQKAHTHQTPQITHTPHTTTQITSGQELHKAIIQLLPRPGTSQMFARLATEREGNRLVCIEAFVQWLEREQGVKVSVTLFGLRVRRSQR